VSCDVSRPDELRAAVAAADQFGGVTVMVNNAGIFRSEDFLEVTESEYETLMDINVKGTFFGAQAAARSMVDGDRSGCIINLSSVAGLRGSKGYATYNTSKGAVRLLTMALADALGPRGIRVNLVAAGPVRTMAAKSIPGFSAFEDTWSNRAPLGWDIHDASAVAKACVALFSDLFPMTTGEMIHVDGGVHAVGGSA